MRLPLTLGVLFLTALAVPAAVAAPAPALPRDAQPLERAHAHNDYEHDRPLLDAADQGFTSVEADVYLVGTELLVAHSPQDVRPEPTLRSAYLDPLRQRVRERRGDVLSRYDGVFTLLVDVKSDPLGTYVMLDRLLAEYRDILWRWEDGKPVPGAVQVIVSGFRLKPYMERQQLRYAGYDGRVAEFGTSRADLVPLISDSFTAQFRWRGVGPMPQEERDRLRRWVRSAHDAGQRVRFYATPDTSPTREKIWAELVAAGVDHLNTDDLPGLRAWLLKNDPQERSRR